MSTHGLVLGKFMPPHLGHLHLIEFARSFVDELTVVVGTLASEPIDGVLRHGWMSELVPGAHVVHLTDENPQLPEEHPDFWGIWQRSLERVVPRPVDFVFASDAYGATLAKVLGATFVPVDPARTELPISGSAIRRDPFAHWDYLPRCVRPFYVRRISVFGPESTGKSTLVRALAERLDATAVPEYARTWLELHADRKVQPADMPIIARGQVASEAALARSARRTLICDTDPLATRVWSELLFGGVDSELAPAGHYDLTLLLDVDVPWIEDGVRYLPDERRAAFDAFEAALCAAQRKYVVIRGSWAERLERSLAAIEILSAQ